MEVNTDDLVGGSVTPSTTFFTDYELLFLKFCKDLKNTAFGDKTVGSQGRNGRPCEFIVGAVILREDQENKLLSDGDITSKFFYERCGFPTHFYFESPDS